MMQYRCIHSHTVSATNIAKKAQEVGANLEGKPAESGQKRVLFQIEAKEHTTRFLRCMEQQLRSTRSPLLVLVSASCQPHLQDMWQRTRSSADGQQRLSTLFPTRYALTLPLERGIRVYITTVRALQLEQIQHEQQIVSAFESMVVYDFPASLSPVWKRVLEKQQSSSLIAFCERPEPEVIQWFEDTRVEEESEEGAAQPGVTQRPPTI